MKTLNLPIGAVSIALAAMVANTGTAKAQMPCSDLSGWSSSGVTVTAATSVAAGTGLPSGFGPAVPDVVVIVPICRVQITLTPRAIQF